MLLLLLLLCFVFCGTTLGRKGLILLLSFFSCHHQTSYTVTTRNNSHLIYPIPILPYVRISSSVYHCLVNSVIGAPGNFYLLFIGFFLSFFSFFFAGQTNTLIMSNFISLRHEEHARSDDTNSRRFFLLFFFLSC